MSRRRASRTRLTSPGILLRLFVVLLLGAGIVSTGGWVPVFVAAALVLVLAGLTSKRGRRRSHR